MTLKPSVKEKQEQCRVSGPFVALDVRTSPFSFLFQKRQEICTSLLLEMALETMLFDFVLFCHQFEYFSGFNFRQLHTKLTL